MPDRCHQPTTPVTAPVHNLVGPAAWQRAVQARLHVRLHQQRYHVGCRWMRGSFRLQQRRQHRLRQQTRRRLTSNQHIVRVRVSKPVSKPLPRVDKRCHAQPAPRVMFYLMFYWQMFRWLWPEGTPCPR